MSIVLSDAQARAIAAAFEVPVTRSPMQSAFALLCSLANWAVNTDSTWAARIPWILLAAMLIPSPVPQIKIAAAHFFSTTAWHAFSAKSG